MAGAEVKKEVHLDTKKETEMNSKELSYEIQCKNCRTVVKSTHQNDNWLCHNCRDHSDDIYISEIEIKHQKSGIRITKGGFTTTSKEVIIRELEKTIALVRSKFQ